MHHSFNLRDLVLEYPKKFEDLVLYFPKRPTVRILIVVDTAVSFTSNFGVGKVIDLIRANVDGYAHFEVDLARLGIQGSTLLVDNSPNPKEPKYDNFRFSSQVDGKLVVDNYDEIWCFGFAPGNDGSPDDDNVTSSPYASTQSDLAVLTQWMNDGGGMLAMGDHHYLGAAMCSIIPRVRSMRRWTNAQNVPPIDGPGRFDTNRPENASQDPYLTPNPAIIPFEAQGDDIPQKIDWKRYYLPSLIKFSHRYRPHPILCGGELGVIDVLPDHPHEGWVYEDEDINLMATYAFNGVSGDEYPTVNSVQARPEAIAWANTLPDPPYNHAKGDSPAKRFAVIGVYDGDRSGPGRVVVDSTWHHWMDINIEGLESETPDMEYQKIVRYYRNCAVWLARKNQRQQMLFYTTFWGMLRGQVFEDFTKGKSIFALGGMAIDVIGRMTSDCLVRDWLDIYLPVHWIEEVRHPQGPWPEPCWSCPPVELMHQAVLGGMVQEMIPMRDNLSRLRSDKKISSEMSGEAISAAAESGAQRGLDRFREAVKDNADRLQEFAQFQEKLCKNGQPTEKMAMHT